MSNYFGKMNKTQLAEYARPLGISSQLRKSELLEGIESALNGDRDIWSKNALYDEYYETVGADSTALVPTPKTTKRRSRYSKPPGDDDSEIASDPPVAETVTPARKKATGPRSTRKSIGSSLRGVGDAAAEVVAAVRDELPDSPLSPGQVAASIPVSRVSFNNMSNAVTSWFELAARTTGFWEQVDFARETLSSARTIHALIATYEFSWLMTYLIPMEIHTVPNSKVHPSLPNQDIKIPDLFVLLSWHQFWAPVLYWFILGVSMPLLSSYFVNISNKSKYDPLSFSITKGLVAYLVYTKQIIRPQVPGLFGPDNAVLVSSIIGDETPLIGAAIGGLLTVWEAILSKR